MQISLVICSPPQPWRPEPVLPAPLGTAWHRGVCLQCQDLPGTRGRRDSFTWASRPGRSSFSPGCPHLLKGGLWRVPAARELGTGSALASWPQVRAVAGRRQLRTRVQGSSPEGLVLVSELHGRRWGSQAEPQQYPWASASSPPRCLTGGRRHTQAWEPVTSATWHLPGFPHPCPASLAACPYLAHTGS